MNTAPAGRDASLDSARGLAVLAILWMHTVYWSGLRVDIPESWRFVSLMFDVPMFFLISGILLAMRNVDLNRTAWSLLRLYAYYAVFVSLCYAGKALTQDATLGEWIGWLLFRMQPQEGLLRVVAGAMWFMPVFIASMLAAVLLQRAGKVAEKLAMAVIFCSILLARREEIPKALEMNWTIVYFTLFVLLGVQLGRHRIKAWHAAALLSAWVLALMVRMHLGHEALPDLNHHKFRHDSVFLFYAVPSLLLVAAIRALHLRAKPLQWLGKKAMPLYLAQGLSGSALYYLLPYTEVFLPVPRIAVHFAANVALAVALAWVMHSAHHRVSELIGPYDRHPRV